MTLMIAPVAQRRGDAPALIDERGHCSWPELDPRVTGWSRAARAGLGRGDSIAMFAGNSREYYEMMPAANHAGIVYVPVNWHFSVENSPTCWTTPVPWGCSPTASSPARRAGAALCGGDALPEGLRGRCRPGEAIPPASRTSRR